MVKSAKWSTVIVMALLAMVSNQCIFAIINIHTGMLAFLMNFVCMIFNGWVCMNIYDVITEK